METIVINVKPIVAEKISELLLERANHRWQPLYVRRETENGFEIFVNNGHMDKIVFRYTDDNGNRKFEYDESRVLIL